MNKATLLKLIAPVVAIVAIVGKQYGFVLGETEVNTVVAALSVLITAIQPAIKGSK